MAGLLKAALLAAAMAAAGPCFAQSAADHVEAGDIRFEGLPQQPIESGHCGLFLWSRSERPVFILYVQDNPAKGTVRLGGKLKAIDRTSTAGKRVFGHFEKQNFSGAGVAFEVDLSFDEDSPVKDGAVIRTGVLRTRMKDGAEAVLPVGGMVGCKAS